MDNQHRLISGYRDLTQEEIDVINSIKQSGALTGDLVAAAERIEGIDARALSIARTHLQTGFMWLTRAVAKPGGF